MPWSGATVYMLPPAGAHARGFRRQGEASPAGTALLHHMGKFGWLGRAARRLGCTPPPPPRARGPLPWTSHPPALAPRMVQARPSSPGADDH
jgi:hypothetical protein